MSTVLFCRWGDEQKVAERFGDCYILSSDNWDDFGYKTSFHVKIFKNNEEYGTFERKILLPVQEELNNHSSLTFIYSFKYDNTPKKGRPSISSVIIDLKSNKNRQPSLF